MITPDGVVPHGRIGVSDLVLPRLGLGCWGMSSAYGPSDDTEARATIRRAVELGVTLLDTSDNYGPDGANEVLVGQAVRNIRDKVVLTTKFGSFIRSDGSRASNGSPEHVRHSCEASLRRLGVEVIDLYLQHRVDPDTPVEETVGAMADLVREGKVRHIGLCEAGPERIRAAHRVHPLAVVQSELSLWSRTVLRRVLPTLRELSIGLMAYSPLGRGFFTGRIRSREDLHPGDTRKNLPRFSAEHLPTNLRLLDVIDSAASELGVTPTQVALAWVLHQGPDVIALAGTTKRPHLEHNIHATHLRLGPDILRRLDDLDSLDVAGERSTPENLRRLEG